MNAWFVAFYHYTEGLMAFALNLSINHFSYIFIFAFCTFVKLTHRGTLSKSPEIMREVVSLLSSRTSQGGLPFLSRAL